MRKIDESKLPKRIADLGITEEELTRMPYKELINFMESKGFPKEWFEITDKELENDPLNPTNAYPKEC